MLYHVVARHFERFVQVYDERFAPRRGPLSPGAQEAVSRSLDCGIFACGFAQVRCSECGHDYFVAFSCKLRCIDERHHLLGEEARVLRRHRGLGLGVDEHGDQRRHPVVDEIVETLGDPSHGPRQVVALDDGELLALQVGVDHRGFVGGGFYVGDERRELVAFRGPAGLVRGRPPKWIRDRLGTHAVVL